MAETLPMGWLQSNRQKSRAVRLNSPSKATSAASRSQPRFYGKDSREMTPTIPDEPNGEASTNVSASSTSDNVLSSDWALRSEPVVQRKALFPPLLSNLASAVQECDDMLTPFNFMSPCLSRDGDPIRDFNVGTNEKSETSNEQHSDTILKKSKDFYGKESSTSESERSSGLMDTSHCSTANRVAVPKETEWDKPRTCQSGKLNSINGELKRNRRISKHGCCVLETVSDEEDASDEGYFVLVGPNDEQKTNSSNDEAYDDYPVVSDYDSEGSPVSLQAGNLNTSEDNDIWSDEDFVFSPLKGFPPPISILANEMRPGLPSHIPRTLWRSVKKNGRFVLQEVQSQPRQFFQTIREHGRLRLQLVRPDSGYSASQPETVPKENIEDSTEFEECVGDSQRISEVCQNGNYRRRTPGINLGSSQATMSSPSKGITFESKEELCGVKRPGNDGYPTSPSLPFYKHPSTLQIDHTATTSQQREESSTVRRRLGGEVFQEITDQTDLDVAIQGSAALVDKSSYLEDFQCTNGRINGSRNMRVPDLNDQGSGSPHGSSEHYRQDYQLKCFNATYGFDNNMNLLSSSPTLMQLPLQSAVR